MTSTSRDRLGDTPDPSTALKGPVKVATTAPITLAGTQTIDTVALVDGNRVLVKNQADQTTNGVYIVRPNGRAWERAADFDGARDVVQGTRVFIASGAAYAGMEATLTTADPVVFGASNITFSLLSVVDTDIAADLETVADNIASVVTVAGISTDVVALAPAAADIPTVADISTDVTAVAAVAAAVAALAPAAADIQAVAAAAVFKYLFATSTSMADPSSGNIRLNNGTLASVTAAAISNTFSGGSDISDFIATWDDNSHSPKSILTIRKAGDADFFAIYGVTAVADDGTWLQLTLSFIATGGGTLSASDALYLANSPGANDGTGVGTVTSLTASNGVKTTSGGAITGTGNLELDIASQAEAQAGSSNAKAMTPLRTAQAITALSFAAGTAMLFAQASAPTGWTKSTTHNDKALRVVSGTPSSGGSTAFSTVMASRTPAGTLSMNAQTLTNSHLPAHGHPFKYNTGQADNLGTFPSTSSAQFVVACSAVAAALMNSTGSSSTGTTTTGTVVGNSTGGGSSFTPTGTFSGTALDFAVAYVDVMIATKD